MSLERITDDMVGRKAYKKHGLFGGMIGEIRKSNFPDNLAPYVIKCSGGMVAVKFVKDIEFVGEADNENKGP